MIRSQNPNLKILLFAVEQLGELVDEMVFLGGCATGILITDPAASPIRVTKDVDAIVQVVSHADYYKSRRDCVLMVLRKMLAKERLFADGKRRMCCSMLCLRIREY